MTQKAVVKRLLANNMAEIEVQRQSACGHDCSKCGGCGTPTERIQAKANNYIGAQVGETVTIKGDNKTVFRAAAIVYTLPIILFFVFYAAAKMFGSSESMGVFAGIIGFVASVIAAIIYNRNMNRNGETPFVIIKRS